MKMLHAALGLALTCAVARGASFQPGDLVVVKATAVSNTTTASILEFNPSTPGGPIQTIAIPGAPSDTSPIRINGLSTTTGYLALSNDRSLVMFTGVNNTTNADVGTLNPRAVVTLNSAGTFTIAATYTGNTNPRQTRGATTLNNTTFYIADQSGQYTNGAVSPSPAGDIRAAKSFGGTVYVGSNSGSLSMVSTSSAASGGSFTGLSGLGSDIAFQDFYLVQSGSHGATYDVLYTLGNNAGVGTISKFSLNVVSGVWGSNGFANTTLPDTTQLGGFGLAASSTGSGANLYFTTGTGATLGNSVVTVSDSAGWGATLSLGTFTTLFTTGSGTLKGIDFAPITPVPEPSVVLGLAMVGLAGFARLGRRAA